MAEFKIATGYVEVEVRYDRNRLKKAAAEAGRDAGDAFTTGFARQFRDNVSDKFNWNLITKEVSKNATKAGRSTAEGFNNGFAERVNKELNKRVDWKRFGKETEKSLGDVGEQAADSFGESFSDEMKKNNRDFLKFVPDFAKNFADEFNKSLPKEMQSGSKQFEKSFRDAYHKGLPSLGREAAKTYVKAVNSGINRADVRYTNINAIKRQALEAGSHFVGNYSDRLSKRMPREINRVFVQGSGSDFAERAGAKSAEAFSRGFQNNAAGGRLSDNLLFGFEKEFASQLPRLVKKNWDNYEKISRPKVFFTGRALATSLSDVFRQEVDKNYRRIGESAVGAFFGSAEKEGYTRTRRVGRNMGSLMGSTFQAAFMPFISKRSGIFRGMTQLGTVMGAAFGGKIGALSAIIGSIAMLTAGAASAAAVLVQLGSEIMRVGRLGLMLPAGFLSLATVIGVGVMATMHLNKAIFGTGAEYEAAIAKIEAHTPAAADAIRGLRDSVSDFQHIAEVAFVEQIPEGLNALAAQMPRLRLGIEHVSNALGGATNNMLLFLASEEAMGHFETILASVSKQIRNARDLLPNLTAGMLTLASAGMPFMERFATWMNNVSAAFRQWTKDIVASGQFNLWMEQGIQVLKDLGAILWDVIETLYVIGSVAGDEGLLGTVRELTSQMSDFFKSAEGRDALEGIFANLNRVFMSFVPVILEVWDALVLLGPAFSEIAIAATPSLATIIEIFAEALNNISPGVVVVLGEIADAWERLGEGGGIQGIASGISNIMVAFAPLIGVVAEIWNVMTQWISAALDGLGNILEPIIALVTGSETLQRIIGVVGAAVVLWFIAPFGLAHGVILGVVGVLSMFSGQLDGRIKAAILIVGGLIGAFFIPQLIAMGVAAASSIGQSISLMGMYSLAWIKAQGKMAAGFIRHTAHLWGAVAGWVRAAAASVASSATQVASWMRVKVASAAAGVASLIATNGIVKGLAMAAASAVSKGAQIVRTLTSITLGSIKAGVASMAAGIKMAAAWVIGLGPIGLIIAAIAGLVAVFVLLWNKSEAFRNFFTGLWEQLKTVAMNAWTQIKDAIDIDAIMSQLSGLKTSMIEAWESIVEAVRPVIEWFSGMWDQHGDKIMTVVKAIGAVFAVIFGGTLLVIFQGVISAIKMVIGVIVGIITTISGVVQGVIGILTGVFTVIKGIFTGDMQTVVDGLKQIWGGLLQILTAPFKGAWEVIKGIWSGISGFFVGIFSTLGVDLGAVFTSLWEGIKNTFNSFVSWVVNFGTTIINWVTAPFKAIYRIIVGNSIIPDLVNAVLGWIRNMLTWIMVPINGIKNFFVTVFSFIYTSTVSVIGVLVRAAVALFSGFVSGVRTIFSGIRNFFSTLWNAVKSIFSTVISVIVNVARTAFNNFVNNTKNIFNGIKNFFTTVWNGIRNTFTTVVNAIWNFVQRGFRNGVANVKNVFNGIRNFFTTVWNGIRNTFTTVVNAIWEFVKRGFRNGINNVKNIFNGIKNFFTTVWNTIRNTIVGAATAIVNRVRNTFSSWVTWIRNKFEELKARAELIWRRLVQGVIRLVSGFVRSVRETFTRWVTWIRDKFEELKARAELIWKTIRVRIINLVNRLVNRAKALFEMWVDWIYDKFNALKKNASNIWNSFKDSIQRIVDRVVKWVKDNFNKWVGWIYDKFNALKKNASNIWNRFKDSIEDIIDKVVKWVKDTFNKWVGWIYDKFNALKKNASNIWDSIRDSIVDKITAFKDKATDLINKFKDGFIEAFENTKKGVEDIWNKVKKVASAPVKFMIETVYNEGIRILWSKIADHVDGLGYLKKVDVPKGFATGGVLPGYSPGRDNMVARTKNGPVGLSGGEAIMRPEWTRAVGPDAVHAMNKLARSKGVAGLRHAMTHPDGFHTGGVAGKAKSGNSLTKKLGSSRHMPMGPSNPTSGRARDWNTGHQGFAGGGIMGWIKDKYEGAKDFAAEKLGDIVGWATKPFTRAFDMLKDKANGGSDKKNFAGMPFHLGHAAWDKVKEFFQGKDDEYNAQFEGEGGDFGTFSYNGKSANLSGLIGTKSHVKMIGNFIAAMFKVKEAWGLGGPPEHSTGRAIDYMVGTGSGQSRGDGISAYYLKNKDPLALQWIIWRQRIWNAQRKNWRKMEDRGNPTQNHFDHPHVLHKGSAPKAKDFISKQKGVKFSGGGGGGSGGGSGNTVMTSFWDAHQPTASGRKMRASTVSSSVIPLGSILKIKVGGKSAMGTMDDLGPSSFVYRRHHPKSLLDLSEPMMQKLTGRRSNVVNGSFDVTKRGTGRTLFGYTKWNGVYDPSKSTKGFASGGMVGGAPLGSGSHDIGGLLPDGHIAYNRSGQAETVHTLDQLKTIVEAARSGDGGIHIHGDIIIDAKNVKEFNDIVKMINDLKKQGRANGANVRFRDIG